MFYLLSSPTRQATLQAAKGALLSFVKILGLEHLDLPALVAELLVMPEDRLQRFGDGWALIGTREGLMRVTTRSVAWNLKLRLDVHKIIGRDGIT
jgi:hypothetical protein